MKTYNLVCCQVKHLAIEEGRLSLLDCDHGLSVAKKWTKHKFVWEKLWCFFQIFCWKFLKVENRAEIATSIHRILFDPSGRRWAGGRPSEISFLKRDQASEIVWNLIEILIKSCWRLEMMECQMCCPQESYRLCWFRAKGGHRWLWCDPVVGIRRHSDWKVWAVSP